MASLAELVAVDVYVGKADDVAQIHDCCKQTVVLGAFPFRASRAL